MFNLDSDLSRQLVELNLEAPRDGRARTGRLIFGSDPGSLAAFDRNANRSLIFGRYWLRTLSDTAFQTNPPRGPFVALVEVAHEEAARRPDE